MAHYRDSISDYKNFQLGDFELQCGKKLPNAQIAYKTLGSLNADKSNVIILNHPVGGTHENAEAIHLDGENRAISPEKHFIIMPNMFGNGLSSSPSNASASFAGSSFPSVTIFDSIRAQYELVTEVFGISEVKLVIGFSMGGLQAYHWAAMYPTMVQNFIPICGTSKCSAHNWLMLESLANTLKTDPAFNNGDYQEYPIAGMKAFCSVYTAWVFSQEFFRQNGHSILGYESIQEAPKFLEGVFIPSDPNDLLAMIRAWQNADISENPTHSGNLKAALSSITAKGFIMPTSTDLYFWADDNRDEAEILPNATFREIPSIWGHAGGILAQPQEREIVDKAIIELIR